MTEENEDDSESDGDTYQLFNVNSKERSSPIEIMVKVEGRNIPMEVDTGAALTLVSESTFKEQWPNRKLTESRV